MGSAAHNSLHVAGAALGPLLVLAGALLDYGVAGLVVLAILALLAIALAASYRRREPAVTTPDDADRHASSLRQGLLFEIVAVPAIIAAALVYAGITTGTILILAGMAVSLATIVIAKRRVISDLRESPSSRRAV